MDERYYGLPHCPSPSLKENLAEERRELETGAIEWGCDLVLHPFDPKPAPKPASQDPGQIAKKFSARAKRARGMVLRSFLVSMCKTANVRVVFNERALGRNTIIYGDWFLAESMTPVYGEGFRHTTITNHAPTVLKWMMDFDRDFGAEEYLTPETAISLLDKHMAGVG